MKMRLLRGWKCGRRVKLQVRVDGRKFKRPGAHSAAGESGRLRRLARQEIPVPAIGLLAESVETERRAQNILWIDLATNPLPA